jgi:hypothetical protein
LCKHPHLRVFFYLLTHLLGTEIVATTAVLP